jgi:dTDP-4-dehydrorhamnose reductase
MNKGFSTHKWLKAKRPHFSVLDNYHLRLLGLDDMRPWPEALEDYMKEKGHLK